MCIELGEPAMIVAMLQHFFLPMKPKMGCVVEEFALALRLFVGYVLDDE